MAGSITYPCSLRKGTGGRASASVLSKYAMASVVAFAGAERSCTVEAVSSSRPRAGTRSVRLVRPSDGSDPVVRLWVSSR